MKCFTHYVPKALPARLKKKIEEKTLEGPMFIGQGITLAVGSDRYGYYINCITTTPDGKKPLIGIVIADSRFIKDYIDGDMACSLPGESENPLDYNPTFWLIPGKKSRKTGKIPWHRCSEDGTNIREYSEFWWWNGAFGYQDPSF